MILNPVGGLANRMRAIASAVSLAHEKNIRIAGIFWALNRELNCPFEELFEPLRDRLLLRNISNLEQLFRWDVPRKKNLFLSAVFQYNKFSHKFIDSEHNIAQMLVVDNSDTRPLFIQSGVIFHDFSQALYRSIFVPREDLLNKAKLRIGGVPTIGIHIRRTDNSEAIAKSPTKLFIERIREELEATPTAKFYLATDDEGVKEELRMQFGCNIISSPMKATRNSMDGVKEALVEMLCLSLCSKIYGSYWSSYSEAAALLGNVPLVQLVAN